MTILDQLADHAQARTEEKKKRIPLTEMRKRAGEGFREFAPFSFEEALKKPGLSFICECKKASPSRGLIASDFPYLKIAREYEKAGADAVSVLTEPKWFLGSDEYLKEIASGVSIPCLRKDFTVDEYMIYEAKALGASAVLLIVSLLEKSRLKAWLQLCDELGLSALTETHDASEIETALDCKARIIGVNNRNLKDFSVNTENAGALRQFVPENVLFVSESGVKTAEDVLAVKRSGADAVLIGEALMTAEDKSEKLRDLKKLL